MRKVLKNRDEVAHYWANKIQDEGKAGNIFFEGDTIYSYGYHFPIARHAGPSTILFTTDTYSSSTSQHISIVRQAIPYDKRVLYVHNIEDAERNRKYLEVFFREHLYKAKRARTKGAEYIQECRSAFEGYKEAYPFLSDLCLDEMDENGHEKFVNTWQDILYSDDANEMVDKSNAAYRKEIERREERDRKAQEKRAREGKKHLPAWKDGDSSYDVRRAVYYLPFAYGRINDDEIETTKGASVSIKKAKMLWTMIKRGKSIHGFNIDGYTVISYTDNVLTIGCHKFEQEEVERIGKLLEGEE